MQLPLHERVQLGQMSERLCIGSERQCNELKQCLGVVRRQKRMCQRRAQCRRMRRFGDAAGSVHAQRLALETAQATPQTLEIEISAEPSVARFGQTRILESSGRGRIETGMRDPRAL